MTIFTTHLKDGEMPVVIAEGGRWLAGILGWLWFGLRGEWLIAVILFAVTVLLVTICGLAHNSVPLLLLALLQGIYATDILRCMIGLRGYRGGPVVTAKDEESALVRLLDTHPELALALIRSATFRPGKVGF